MNNHESKTLVVERPITGIPAIENELKRNCYHYWLIERPTGPFSHGVCKFCREERDFSNVLTQIARPREILPS